MEVSAFMNKNGTQIFMINMIFSFFLRSPRPLRFIYTRRQYAQGAPTNE
jgi:hypothetical protein